MKNKLLTFLYIDYYPRMADISTIIDIYYDNLTRGQQQQFKTIKCLPNCQMLKCDNIKQTVLPELPNCRGLYCYHNQLTSLPELPNCKILNCSYNQITVLPELPNCETLECSHNQITVLPELPNCRELYCYRNNLTVLPELPKCETLECCDNNLISLPKLPNCQKLIFSGGQLTVLPELPKCRDIIGFDCPQIYYTKQLSRYCNLKYPSPGHRKYFVGLWKKCFHKIKLINILMEETGFDKFVATKIVSNM